MFPVVLIGSRSDAVYLVGYADRERDVTYPPFAQCLGSCQLYAPPAKYAVEVRGKNVREGKRTFELKEPSKVTVTPRDDSDRTAGLAMGVIGIVMIAGGLVLLATTAENNDGGGADNLVPGSPGMLGLAILAGGAVLTPIGFVRYGATAPTVKVEPLRAAGD